EDFMSKYVKRNGLELSTAGAYRRALCGKDVEHLKDQPITSITKRDVHDLLDSIVERGSPIAANRTLAYLRKFFNWCEERGVIPFAPTDKVRPPSKAVKRERALSNDEVAEVWAAFEKEGGTFGAMFKLLLLTGQRRDEVAGMRWDELKDLDGESPM